MTDRPGQGRLIEGKDRAHGFVAPAAGNSRETCDSPELWSHVPVAFSSKDMVSDSARWDELFTPRTTAEPEAFVSP